MGDDALSATEARDRLYEAMDRDLPFEEKARLALSVGEAYLGVENVQTAVSDGDDRL